MLKWIAPALVEILVNCECTAYAGALEDIEPSEDIQAPQAMARIGASQLLFPESKG
jgi:hypothetical protein